MFTFTDLVFDRATAINVKKYQVPALFLAKNTVSAFLSLYFDLVANEHY